MQLYSIASGSSGNCIYVGGEEARILIDAGISMKRIREGLMEENFPIENLHAIFITHEHTDHICGLRTGTAQVPDSCLCYEGND